MGYTKNLEDINLLDLEWFIYNNGIINSKTQELFLSNDEYKVHILLNKGMSGAYIEAPNQSRNKKHSDESDSMGINEIYGLSAKK